MVAQHFLPIDQSMELVHFFLLVHIFCDWVAQFGSAYQCLASIHWSHTTYWIALSQSLDKLLSLEGVYLVPRWSAFVEKARACSRLQIRTISYEANVFRNTHHGFKFGECEQCVPPLD